MEPASAPIEFHAKTVPVYPGISGPISESKNITFENTTALAADVYAANVLIEPGATVYSEGYNFYVTGSFVNHGSIITGYAPFENFPKSYGGSGGGGLNTGGLMTSGYSTLSPGGISSYNNSQNATNGLSPEKPAINRLLIQHWHSEGFSRYLSGAGGGYSTIIPGGGGGNGIYIQADSLIAGNISSAGGYGLSYFQLPSWGLNQYSGGGGGGVILLAFGDGGYVSGNYSFGGGRGTDNGAFIPGALIPYPTGSGRGGNGRLMTYGYGYLPPVKVSSYSHSFYDSGQYFGFKGATVNYGLSGSLGSKLLLTGTSWFTMKEFNASSYTAEIRWASQSGPASGGYLEGVGPGNQNQSVYGIDYFPFLNAAQINTLREGKVPSGTMITNGTVINNVRKSTSDGMVNTFEIVTSGSKYWFSESSGLLIEMYFVIGVYSYSFIIRSTNIPLSPTSYHIPGEYITLTVAAMIITSSVLILLAASKYEGKKIHEVREMRSNVQTKKELLEALKNTGRINESEYLKYIEKLDAKTRDLPK